MRIDLEDITAIPSRFGLGFVTELLNSMLGVNPGKKHHHDHKKPGHCENGGGRPGPVFPPAPILPPTPRPGIDDELEVLLGRQVQVNTNGGQVGGILAVVRRDYLVLNNGTDFLLVPTDNMQGVVTID